MPFDALTTDLKSNDALANLGIVPVPWTLVEDYKRTIVRRFADRSYHNWCLVDRQFAIWRNMPLHGDLAKRLAHPPTKHHSTEDITGAPKPLIDLAVHVRNRVSDAVFSLEYFDTDPVLNVRYGGQIACLGIWDQGQLVHIAEWQGALSWFDRLSQRFPRLAALF